MHVSSLLEQKGSEVATITGDTSVTEAVAQLAERRIGALVVSDDGRSIAGIISERDIVRCLNEAGAEVGTRAVASIMSTTVHTCAPGDDVESLMRLMTDHRVRHIPVLADGELCGLVSIGDVVKSRIGELEKDRRELMDYISAR